ncbi:uncharacterized protein DEA37_0011961, partial [Paragonimus westermani]
MYLPIVHYSKSRMCRSRRTYKNSIQLPSKRTVNRWKRRCMLTVDSTDWSEDGIPRTIHRKNMDRPKCYCVAKIEADDNEDVAVISSSWLDAAGKTAVFLRPPGTAYYRYAQNHLQPSTDDPKLPVTILVTTIDFEHAREMEVRYTSGNLPSSDDTTNMKLLPKRPIKRPRFTDDDSEVDGSAKRRKCEPSPMSYSVQSCSSTMEQRRP